MKNTSLPITKLDILAGTYLIWSLVVGYIKTDLTLDSLLYAEWVGIFLIYFIVSRAFRNTDTLPVLFTLTLVGLVQAIVVITQAAGILENGHTFFHITGFMGNPGPLGGFQAIALVSGVSLSVSNRTRQAHRGLYYFYLCVIGLIICSMVLSESRSGIIAAVAGLGVLFRLKIKNFFANRSIRIVAAIGLSLVFACILIFHRPSSVLARLLIWIVSALMFIDHPITGIGPGQFNMKYMLYQAEYFRTNPDSCFTMVADNVAYPYNEFLHILIEQGIIGFMIVILLILAVFRNARHNDVLAPLATLIVFSCFSYPSYDKVLVLLFPILIGAAGCNATVWNFSSTGLRNVVYILSTIAGVSILSHASVSYRNMMDCCDGHKPVGNRLNTLFSKNYTDHKINALYSDFIFKNPELLDDRVLGKVFPMCETWCRIGELMEKNHDLDSAEHYYVTAAYMIPTRIRPRYLLWEMMLKQGRDNEAEILAKEILSRPVKVENTFTLRVKQKLQDKYEIEQTSINEH